MATELNKQERCPNCEQVGISLFYQQQHVPVHSVMLLHTRQEALNYPTGEIALGFCPHCGFIGNLAYDESLQHYSANYEATQGFSPTFSRFHKQLAQDLIERYGLKNKQIIEIGCDKGDFITLLCQLGNNEGVGFDPAYVPNRIPNPMPDRLRFVADFYSAQYAQEQADFLCCKMTLEHIGETAVFTHTIRQAIQNECIVFFQVPNAAYLFGDVAFWDIYYEHCSYFYPQALRYLFESTGFAVQDVWTAYDNQYLMLTCATKPTSQKASPLPNIEAIQQTIEHFTQEAPARVARWQAQMEEWLANGRRVILWGGGSKAVAFLTTLNIGYAQMPYVVDINPHKTGTFLAGCGQEVIAPESLCQYQPDVVVIMNPVYTSEISKSLHSLGIAPIITTVEAL